MEVRDPATGQIKPWVWIGGAGIIGVLFLLGSRGGGSSGVAPVEAAGQSSAITPQLKEVMDAIKELAAKQNPTSPNNPQNPSNPNNPNNPTNPNDDDDRPDRPNRPNRPPQNRDTPILDWFRDLIGGGSWVPRTSGQNPSANPTNALSERLPIINSQIANLAITGGGGDSQNGNLGRATVRDFVNFQNYSGIVTRPQQVDRPLGMIDRNGVVQQNVRNLIPNLIFDRFGGGTIQPIAAPTATSPIPSGALPRPDRAERREAKREARQRNQENVTT